MAKTETNVDNLKINYLTKQQYDEALASGSINLNEMYITPEEEEQGGTSPVTTSGTGAAYTASVNGITSLVAGATFTMVPHVASTSTAPTLNVNGLGAKSIRRRVSNSTSTTVASSAANWLAAGKPINVMYDGTFWIADMVRPNATDIYGTISSDQLGSDIGTVAVQSSEPTDSHVKIWIQTT